ncbi:MAG: cyclic nucleotide-binding domain-containing protein [Deltaproteobacteria bacterium]|nr:cyclic nucleotide-binding domain-containing protein [Deltaproteobacteria bacterium]
MSFAGVITEQKRETSRTMEFLAEKDISFLQETELFRNLSQVQIRKVLDVCRLVTFAEDEVIAREGEEGDTMYIILDGIVEVVKSLIMSDMDEDREKSKVFTKLTAEDHAVFGEIALLEQLKRTATIRAVTKCTLYEITRDAFLNLTGTDHELGYRIFMNLARIISARLRKADEDTVKLTTVLSIVLKES